MLWASFAFPAAIAPESIVSRCGWYQAVPSQPRGSPLSFSCPRCAWAARRPIGEVLTSSAYPYCPSFVGATGGFKLAGSAGHDHPSDGSFGAIFTPVEPLALKRPAYGAGMPPKLSQGEPFARAWSRMVASSGLTGAGLLPPSMNTRPDRSLAPAWPLKSQVA